ncbi:hypothetical protein FRB96_006596 [Tulasnella sp. 330]|nr:hypothetical protein FRB96_006596 [Tulasnella sp. 330]KAG8884641.1 hypothetical protein FRB97_003697 [Tulasnella sp. 331]KAG8889728.1 hypothetical protein FRB98_003020 [Tulasnella sp. 332]
MSSLTVVSTKDAPAALGPYSMAIKTGNLVFASGCIPMDPETMEIVAGGIEEQTAQSLKNLKAVVEASGSSMNGIAKTTVFLKNMGDFAAMNKIYAEKFGNHKPARSAVRVTLFSAPKIEDLHELNFQVEVARLPKDVLVEIECIAVAE